MSSSKMAKFRARPCHREHYFERSQCGSKRYKDGQQKRSFPDFLTAIYACKNMLTEKKHINPLYVYYCSFCDAPHIGHLAKGESVLMYGGECVDIRVAQGIT